MTFDDLKHYGGPATKEYFDAVVAFVRDEHNPMQERASVIVVFDLVTDQPIDHYGQTDRQIVESFVEAYWNNSFEITW